VVALSAVLPAALLLSHTEGKITPPLRQAPLSSDPWQSAEGAVEVTQTLINRIKATLKVEDLLGPVTPSGDGFGMTLCPLHDDHNPSMWVKGGVCGCYAGCTDKPLDVINLYARLFDLSNHDAITALAGVVK